MPYQLDTQGHIENVHVAILDASAYIDDIDVKHFTNNIDKWECRGQENESKEFIILKYSVEHREIHCRVFRLGCETFRGWMLESIGLDIDNYTTSQMLWSHYELKEGCYKDDAMFSGVVQHCISNCIIGGRCITNNNDLYHLQNKHISMLELYTLQQRK